MRLIDSPFFNLEKSYGALFISPGGPIGPGGPGGPGGPSEPRVGDPGGPRAPGIPGVPGSPGQRQMRKSLSAQYSASNFHILYTTVKSHSHKCPFKNIKSVTELQNTFGPWTAIKSRSSR